MQPKFKYIIFFFICILSITSSCFNTPNSSTIIIGKVIDSNNKPMENVKIGLTGIETRGLASITTFHKSVETDSGGNFKFESVYPRKTDFVLLAGLSNSSFNFLDTLNLFIERNGKFELPTPETIYKDQFGKTHAINLQLRKRNN